MTKFTGDIQAWSKELLQTYKDQLKHMKVVSTEIKGNTLIIVTQNLSGESPLIGKWCIALTPRKDGTVYEKGGSYNKKLKKWQFSLPGEIPTIGQAMKRIARKYGISENLNSGKIFMKKSMLNESFQRSVQKILPELKFKDIRVASLLKKEIKTIRESYDDADFDDDMGPECGGWSAGDPDEAPDYSVCKAATDNRWGSEPNVVRKGFTIKADDFISKIKKAGGKYLRHFPSIGEFVKNINEFNGTDTITLKNGVLTFNKEVDFSMQGG